MERGEGGGNRQREGERELERKKEEVNNTEVNYMDIHVHSRII